MSARKGAGSPLRSNAPEAITENFETVPANISHPIVPIWQRPLQAYWAICLGIGFVLSAFLSSIPQYVPFVPQRRRNEISTGIIGWVWYVFLVLSTPWLKIQQVGQGFRDLPPGAYGIANHSSRSDALIWASICPTDILSNTRTLMKASLFNVPAFGTLCRNIGHFPVYFLKDSEGSFTVDRVKQAKVMADVKEHIALGGRLTFFPEGQLNPKPRQLQTFRRGSFNVAIENKMPVWGYAIVNCESFWPLDQTVGGLPATVYYTAFEVCSDASQHTVAELLTMAETKMQQAVNELYEYVDGKKKIE
eukprot:Clim_evm4s172 gene=Clim_evmTU4s172